MAAQFEEIIIDADVVHLKHLFPNVRQLAFDFRTGFDKLSVLPEIGIGQPFAIDFAVDG